MKTQSTLQDILRLLRNLIRTGVIIETDLDAGRCRVQTGGIVTDWLQWLTARAGRSRTWWAPSVGEQVLILAVGGELDTAFVLPAIFSDDFPAPSTSADAFHITFPDGAIIEYEPDTSALSVKRVIDEQAWLISKVTHNLNNNGFTTGVELEVRLSDVEYEAEVGE